MKPSGQEETDRFILIKEASGHGIWDLNFEEEKYYFNSRFYTLGGYKDGDYPETPVEWERRIHPEESERVRAAFREITEGRQDLLEEEYRFRTKTGNYLWLKTRGRVTEWTKDHKPIRFLAIHSDITEKKNTELELIQREENFQTLFNTISNVVIIYSSDGRIIYTNRTASELLGYSEEDFHSMKISELYPRNLKSEAESRVNETLNRNMGTFILPLMHFSGKQVQVETKVYAGLWNGKKSIYHISRDISEETRLEREMKQIKSAVELSRDAVIIIDQGRDYLYHNMAMTNLFHYSTDEMKKMELPDLFKNKKTGSAVLKTIHSKGILNSEFEVRSKEGRCFPVFMRAYAIKDARGRLSALSFTFIDISELKDSERQLRESEERLNLALTASNNGVWDWNSADKNIYLDTHCFTIAGYEPEGFSNTWKDIEKKIHPEDLRSTAAVIGQLESGTLSRIELEFRFKRKNDSWMWILMSGNAVNGPDTGIIRYTGTLSDITDQKTRTNRNFLLNGLQTRLIKQTSLKTKLKDIAKITAEAVEADIVSIRLISPGDLCNKKCIHKPECGKNISCYHLVANVGPKAEKDPENERIPLENLKTADILGSKNNSILNNSLKEDPSGFEPRWIEEKDLNSVAVFNLYGQNGRKNGIFTIFSGSIISPEAFAFLQSLAGITSQIIHNAENQTALEQSRKEAINLAEDRELSRREALEMNEQLSTIRMAMNSSSDGIAVSTSSGEFIYVNKTFSLLFGCSLLQLAATPQELLFEDGKIFTVVLNVTKQGIGWYGYVEMLTFGGKSVPVYLRVIPFKDKNDVIIGLVWNFTDISEQRESERKIELYTRRIEKDLAEKEAMLIKARRLQKYFIQTGIPVLNELNIHALFIPCENLGGDFFNLNKGIHDNKLVIILGDCTDHGIKASMDASILTSIANQNLGLLFQENRTDLFLNKMSIEYQKIGEEDQFPTIFVAIIDLETKRMYYSNANGELPFLKHGKEIAQLERVEGMHIGFLDEPDYERKYCDLNPGDRLFIFSDALKEIKQEDGSRTGITKLKEILSSREEHPKESFERVIENISGLNSGLPLEDDTTFIQIDFLDEFEEKYIMHSMESWEKWSKEIKTNLLSFDFGVNNTEKITIALKEMCMNGIEHGNRGDKTKELSIRAKINFKSVCFEITDQGSGFKPAEVRDPVTALETLMENGTEEDFTHGRGIWISRHYMDSVEYNETGNSVKIIKNNEEKKVRFSW